MLPVTIDEIFVEHQKSEIVVEFWMIPVWVDFNSIYFSNLYAEKILQLALPDVS